MAIRTPRPTIADQIAAMKARYPAFVFQRKANGTSSWRGMLQPHPDFSQYEVGVFYKYPYQPNVWVVSPDIQSDAPHRYSDKSLCLYRPRSGNWTHYMRLAETIVPWTALWLAFYEIWLDTGHWYGPEAPHGQIKQK